MDISSAAILFVSAMAGGFGAYFFKGKLHVKMNLLLAFGASYLLPKLLSPNPDVSPEEFQQILHTFRVVMSIGISVGPVIGLTIISERFTGLPTDEAKYLDGKVQEFYK